MPAVPSPVRGLETPHGSCLTQPTVEEEAAQVLIVRATKEKRGCCGRLGLGVSGISTGLGAEGGKGERSQRETQSPGQRQPSVTVPGAYERSPERNGLCGDCQPAPDAARLSWLWTREGSLQPQSLREAAGDLAWAPDEGPLGSETTAPLSPGGRECSPRVTSGSLFLTAMLTPS